MNWHKKDVTYWYVERSSGDGSLSSSRAIIISRKTGNMIYDGVTDVEG